MIAMIEEITSEMISSETEVHLNHSEIEVHIIVLKNITRTDRLPGDILVATDFLLHLLVNVDILVVD